MQSAHRFSYTIVGDQGVGKTCLQLQFTARKFPEVHDLTIGVEFGRRTINVDGKRIQLDIWDTAGHEAFVPITKQFYCTAACIILVYDITRRETFDHIAILLERARNLSRAGVTLVLIRNKRDLSHMRAVSYEEGRKFAKTHNLVFMEASAKTTQNVDEAFILNAERIYKKVQDGVLDLSEKREYKTTRQDVREEGPRVAPVSGDSSGSSNPGRQGRVHLPPFPPPPPEDAAGLSPVADGSGGGSPPWLP